MTLDPGTLWVSLAALSATVTCALTLLWWQSRELPGLGSLALGHGFIAAGGVLISGAGHFPYQLSFTGGNALVVLGAALVVDGMRLLHGLPARGRGAALLLAGAALTASLAGQAGGVPPVRLGIVATNLLLGALFADAAGVALRRGRRSGEAVIAGVLALSFAIAAVARLTVAGLTLAGVEAGAHWQGQRPSPSLLNASLLASIVAGLFWTFGLFASVNRRLVLANLRQAEYRASLSEVALSVMNRLELMPLLEALVSRGTALLEAERGFLYLETPDASALRCRVWVGQAPVDERVAPDEGAAGQAWRRGEAVSVSDYDAWPGRSPQVPHGLFGSMLAVPLRGGGRPVGALAVAQGRPGRRFREEQAALLASFGDLASIALDNARLFERERAERERAERLHQEARREIDERRRAQAALERSESRHRDLFEQGLGLICTHDLQGRLLSVNPAAAGALGFAPEELIGRNLRELLAEPQRAGLDTYLAQVQHAGQASGIMTVVTAAGRPRNWRYKNVLRRAPEGPAHVIGFAQDITEELASQSALRDSEERFRQVADNLDAVLFVRQVRPHAVLYISPAYRRIFGRDPADLAADAPTLFADVLPEDRARVLAAFESEEREQRPFDETYRIVRPDGAVRWVRTRAFPGLRSAQGRVERVVGLCEDVTPVKHAEELRADLVRMLVHDLRTPLTAIVGCLDLLRSGESARNPDLLPMAARSAEKLRQLVDTILEIDRLEHGALPLRRRPVALAGLAAEACALVAGAAARKRVTLTRAVDEGLPAAWADPQLLLRVLTNLLGNAVKFVPPGGHVAVSAEAAAAGLLRLRVRDSGPGVAHDLAPRLFQKFVTGRSAETGSGLGLAFCRLVAEAHGGSVALEPGPGPGAVFVLTVPTAPGAPPPSPAP